MSLSSITPEKKPLSYLGDFKAARHRLVLWELNGILETQD